MANVKFSFARTSLGKSPSTTVSVIDFNNSSPEATVFFRSTFKAVAFLRSISGPRSPKYSPMFNSSFSCSSWPSESVPSATARRSDANNSFAIPFFGSGFRSFTSCFRRYSGMSFSAPPKIRSGNGRVTLLNKSIPLTCRTTYSSGIARIFRGPSVNK